MINKFQLRLGCYTYILCVLRYDSVTHLGCLSLYIASYGGVLVSYKEGQLHALEMYSRHCDGPIYSALKIVHFECYDAGGSDHLEMGWNITALSIEPIFFMVMEAKVINMSDQSNIA